MRGPQGHPLSARPLTAFTRERLEALFAPEHWSSVETALTSALEQILPDRGPIEMERFQCAVLRVSGGTVSGLEDALKLAGEDWRDLLMAARFFEPPYFRKWQPRRLSQEMADEWRAGAALAGVDFAPGAAVSVEKPGHRSRRGHIRDLLSLEPSTRYWVELATDDTPGAETPITIDLPGGEKRPLERELAPTLEVWQSCLRSLED